MAAVVGSRRLVDPRKHDPARTRIVVQPIDKGGIDEPGARRVTKIGGCLVGADVAPTLRVETVEGGTGVSDTDTGGGRLTERNIETEHRAMSCCRYIPRIRCCRAACRQSRMRPPTVAGPACRVGSCSIVLALAVPVIGLITLRTRQLDAFHMRGPQSLELLGGAVTRLRRGEAGRTGLELRQCIGDGGSVRAAA